MKRLLLSILLFSLLPLTLACANHSTPPSEHTISGTVTQTRKSSFLVDSNGIEYQINYDSKHTTATKNASPVALNQIKSGDNVTVTYNGQVTRSLPPQIFALTIDIA